MLSHYDQTMYAVCALAAELRGSLFYCRADIFGGVVKNNVPKRSKVIITSYLQRYTNYTDL